MYLHRAGKAVEYMVVDALLEANAAWGGRLAAAIHDPAAYAQLTDCVLREIEGSRDPALARARSIVRDLRCRRLYKFVDGALLPVEVADRVPKPITGAHIAAYCPDPSLALDPRAIVVHDLVLNYG